MKKDNKTICSYCGKRFNFDTMKYGLCSDCYEMIIRLGYENGEDAVVDYDFVIEGKIVLI